MASESQWTQVFQGEYFLHIDYRDSESLKKGAAREDAEQVLKAISTFPYPKRETIPNDFEFPPSSLEEQEDSSSRLYQLQAIETNCFKLSEILDSVSGRIVTVEEKFKHLLRYVSDTDFRQYVEKSLGEAIEASQCQQLAAQIVNDPAQRKEADDSDPEDLGSISSMFDSYRIAGYNSALDDVVRIAQQALASSQSAEAASREVLKIAQQAQETAESSRGMAAQLQAQIEETRTRVDELTGQAIDAAEKANNAWNQVEETRTRVDELTGQATDAAEKANNAWNQVEETRARVDELTGQATDAAEKANNAWNQVEETRTRVDKLTVQATNAVKKANNAWDKVQDATDEAKNLIPNMLTVLGIFVAIIIAVVGCYLSVLLNPPEGDSATVGLATYLVMGHILVNIIFLLLYFISKLTDRQIACYCHRANLANCGACTESCTWFSRMWIRYPVVVMLNSAFSIGYYILFFSQVVLSIYPKERMLDWVQAKPERPWCLIAALSVVLLIIVSVFAIMLHTAGTRQKKVDPPAPADAAPGGTDRAPDSNDGDYAAVAEGAPGDRGSSDPDSGG